MVGACGAIWLAALAMGVIATVALARLASGRVGGGEQHSSWLLYTIIAVSALIIAGSIPLLLRARRGAAAEPALGTDAGSALRDQRRTQQPDPSIEKVRVFGVDPYAQRRLETPRALPAVPSAILDRLWLRGTVALLGAMGLAMTAVGAASYLLASGSDTGAWVAFGLAGVITVAMPAVLAFYQRQLAEAVDEAG
jgi:hypothetical protein